MTKDRFEAWERGRVFAEHLILDVVAVILLTYSVVSMLAVGLRLHQALGIGLATSLIGTSRARRSR